MFNKVILIGRLGQNAEAKTAQKSWKNDKGDYENRTEWHRVYAWRNLSKFAKTLQKGQLITLEGVIRYREVVEDVEGAKLKHRIAEIHAISVKRLSKVEAADGPSEGGRRRIVVDHVGEAGWLRPFPSPDSLPLSL